MARQRKERHDRSPWEIAPAGARLCPKCLIITSTLPPEFECMIGGCRRADAINMPHDRVEWLKMLDRLRAERCATDA